jgi:protein SCO1/2
MRFAVLGIACITALQASAQIMKAPDPPDVGIDQKLGSQIPLNLSFRDESGEDVLLSDLIKDKPVVLSLVYYECPMLCNEIMRGELTCFNDMKYTLGDEFTAISVSIDPEETSFVASAKKQTYAGNYKNTEAFTDWRFLTGDEENIRVLADAVGYRYRYLPSTGEFAHGSAIMVVTPKGKVARYFYGIDYPERDVRFGLMEAADERLGSLADELLLLCYQYDPATGTYGAIIFGILRIAGVITMLSVVALVGFLLRSERKAKRVHESAELVNGHAPAAGPTT